MEAARAAVNKITGNRGHHTTVDETVNPAVTREVIKPHVHEEATQAIDREVHQHHYHTTVQPLQHQETLPEKHTHNILPAEEREFHHDNTKDTEARLASELGHFKDTRRVEQVTQTQATAPTVTGEHVHHHVHETVVPVVHKEIIQPEVIHTTKPIHETHHAAAQHHGLSALPMKTLDEFSKAGGVLSGGKHGAHEEYDGPPRKYNDKLSTTFDKLGLEAEEALHGGRHSGTTGTTGTTTGGGLTGSHHQHGGVDNKLEGREAGLTGGNTGYGNERGSGLTGSNTGYGNERGSGLTGRDDYDNTRGTSGTTGGSFGKITDHTRGTGNTGTTGASTRDKLDPRTDADGDGRRGVGN
ncbi:hypothetical protein LTS07_002634 [Exophiala sideris]|uniref:Allergen n=1 Tax=Exophiala sideris TaxID=1016849 RepID=A0ABR0JKE5_9EURO|nr:hypothetical protein LTS07_002634 [Exophiala sideris]KAK5039450.1 hypothetical protein LTR13_003707 [Exophiala sideris]KAK5066122.1 hypothetical protein LTR69_002640 [Exophiala sideris]KAK5186799.1 hypothetical protein LTR44_000805 [Eurotiomycetes sp. CCFEE 6388]